MLRSASKISRNKYHQNVNFRTRTKYIRDNNGTIKRVGLDYKQLFSKESQHSFDEIKNLENEGDNSGLIIFGLGLFLCFC